MTKEEIKKFIKDNLVIDCQYENKYGSGQNQVVSLRFRDDEKPFCEEAIYIPESI